MSNRKRTVGINIRVTDSEKKRIARYAKRCKLSVSEYLRRLANGHTLKELPNDRMYDLCWQIELLIDDFGKQKDERFKAYLSGMLDDLRLVCGGHYPLTETEMMSIGDDQDMGGEGQSETLGGLCEQPRKDGIR